METRRRSVVKALSWRFVAAIITTLVVLGITGKGDLQRRSESSTRS